MSSFAKCLLAAPLLVCGSSAALAATCSLPQLADQVDLKPVPNTDLMTVPVQINDKPMQFLLDIRAAPTEISVAGVVALGLPEAAKLTESITAGSIAGGGSMQGIGVMSASVVDARGGSAAGAAALRSRVRVGTFAIGAATNKNMQLVVAEDRDMGNSEPWDGLMTTDFFHQYDLELDFGGRGMYFLTPTRCTDPNQAVYWTHTAVAVLPMSIVNDRIQVPVTIEGHTINAVLDTSAPRTIMRRDVAELTFGLGAADLAAEAGVTDGTGQPVFNHTFKVMSFDGITAADVAARIQTGSMVRRADRGALLTSRAQFNDARIPDLAIGMDVLHHLHLYIVYGQGKIFVTPAG